MRDEHDCCERDCCGGVERLTPAATANAPALPALSYRVGTHATFLATMLARLSSHYLETPSEDLEEGAPTPPPVKLSPLRALTARVPEDFTVALLDAWATVADVLTFYQERIANEGFLRTATERRSVRELARLLGYRPRPGVAASVFLAYTMDEGAVVRVPAGSSAQSVPEQDEKPQTFETSHELDARAEWNTLGVRQTRPHSYKKIFDGTDRRLFFKGIATGLNVNDPLLVEFGAATPTTQKVYRVTEVNADPAEDRTAVTIEPWLREAQPGQPLTGSPLMEFTLEDNITLPMATRAAAPDEAAGPFVARVTEAVARFTDEEEFGALFGSQTAKRVLPELERLRESATPDARTLHELLVNDFLPKLREERKQAEEAHFTRLAPWLGAMVEEFEAAAESYTPPAAAEVASDAPTARAVLNTSNDDDNAPILTQSASSPPAQPPPPEPPPPDADLDRLLKSLEAPASVPPPNPLRMERDLTLSFRPGSETATSLLTALRPALRPLLYRALADRPVAPPVALKVYALRARASVFGHNAPRRRFFDRSTGEVTRTEEWELFRSGVSTDFFQVAVFMVRDQAVPGRQLFKVSLGLGSASVNAPGGTPGTWPLQNTSSPLVVPFPAANETVNITITSMGVQGLENSTPWPFNMKFEFVKYGFSVEVKVAETKKCEIVSTSSNVKYVQVGIHHFMPSTFPIINWQGETAPTFTVEGKVQNPAGRVPTEQEQVVTLDSVQPRILPGSWVVVERPDHLGNPPNRLVVRRAVEVTKRSRADYDMAGEATNILLDGKWLNLTGQLTDTFPVIRGASVFAQSELLELTDGKIDPVREAVCGGELELDGLYGGLEPGRWLIVTGERTDVRQHELPKAPGGAAGGGTNTPHLVEHSNFAMHTKLGGGANTAPGVPVPETPVEAPVIGGLRAVELAMIAGVEHRAAAGLAGDKTHTFVRLANPLAYCYRRDTLAVFGNVVKATHGETQEEVLGSGDASQPHQTFTLTGAPLTYVSAPTPSGVASTLGVRVNDILWHEADNLARLGPNDRRYVTRADEEGATAVQFGDGRRGARPPTGVENVTARYRVGLGRAGNVKEGQIKSPLTQPRGVKSIINPLPATGGADAEPVAQTRRNAPLAVMSLDRLVSVRDYEDFARTFAGIGKASATRLTDGSRQFIFLTVAGDGDVPIDKTSDLYQNLRLALHKFGDPFTAVKVETRKLKVLVVDASLRVHPDYLWESVEPKVRAALLARFSFDERALGQDVTLSEVVSAAQSVEGVLYVDVNVLSAVDEDITAAQLATLASGFKLEERITVETARVTRKQGDPRPVFHPAELAVLSPEVRDTLILREVLA